MGVNASKIDFKDPDVDYTTRGIDDPDGIGRIVVFREHGYDTGYDTKPVTGFDSRTRGEKGPLRAVQLYSKSNFSGEIFEVDYGNYPSDIFIPAILPSNVFSLTIPPRTTIKLFAGNEYNFGGKGGMSLTNVGPDLMRVDTLPTNIRGQIRSVSVISHSIDRAGEIENPDSSKNELDTIITTDRGDVITAGMMVRRGSNQNNQNNQDNGKLNTNVEQFRDTNIQYTDIYSESVIAFLIILIVIVIFLMFENKPIRDTLIR